MLLKMTRVQIVGSRARLNATIATLHRLGILHIEECAKSSALKRLAPDEVTLRLQDRLEFLAARLDSLIQLLSECEVESPERESPSPQESVELAEWVGCELERITPGIQNLTRRRDELRAEAMSLPRYEATLRKLAPLAVELPALDGYDTVAMLIDKRYHDVLDLIGVEVGRATQGKFEIVARDVDEGTVAALLVYPRSLATGVQAVLGQENITQIRLPKEIAGRTFREALKALEERQGVIRDDLARIKAELENAAHEWLSSLIGWRREIRNRIHQLTIRPMLGATTYTFVLQGWLPRRELGRLRETLSREVGEQVIVSEIDLAEADKKQVPVVFANPAPLRPFEVLVRVMPVPRYGSLDPTPLVAVFLPLFFGIIVGDAGHGALMLMLAVYLKRRFAAKRTISDLAQILMYGSLWAIVFGFLFGEFFGSLGSAIGLRPLWMPREGRYILALFAFALALGVVQVVTGLLLGAWEAWREKHRGEMVTKVGMLVVLSAIFGLIGIAADYIPHKFFTPTAAALLIGLALLIVPTGLMGLVTGPLEVLETVSNILSYLRLAAIGIASVYLALVANELAGLMGNVLVGAIIALLLHGLNFALGIMSPAIQSLRLQYVEFFRQFYRGGGEVYRPFKVE